MLQARGEASTDLSLYEEVKADRRSARDTRDNVTSDAFGVVTRGPHPMLPP